MKNAMQSVGVVALFALTITLAQADPFIHPPETYAPVWHTMFPYQRNIDMGFGVNPVGAPGLGIPGAVYEGWLDPTLKISDYVSFTGSVGWYGTVSGITQTGLIGIDNRLGSGVLTGTAVFHIDNTAEANKWKDIWVETLAITGYAGANAWLSVSDPQGGPAAFLGGDVIPYGDEWLSDYEFQITPNPLYETVLWEFEVPAGTYEFIDETHIATECVPEPATFSLLAVGALAVLWRRRLAGA
jgi:hypothetical protein